MKTKKKEIPPRIFKEPRASILRVLVDELSKWESTEKCTTQEIVKLVDRLESIIKN